MGHFYFENNSCFKRVQFQVAKKSYVPICANCNYNKHVEVCHIKGISDFPDDAQVKEINHVDNLRYLCRNCHWELDNGLINPQNF